MSNAIDLINRIAERERTKLKTVKASKQFVKHFTIVAAHYRCDPDEIEEMKQVARKDMKNAEESFSFMYNEIMGDK